MIYISEKEICDIFIIGGGQVGASGCAAALVVPLPYKYYRSTWAGSAASCIMFIFMPGGTTFLIRQRIKIIVIRNLKTF